MRRLFYLFLIIVIFMSACSKDAPKTSKEVSTAAKADSAILIIGVLPTLESLPLFVADEKGWLKDGSHNIRLETFTSQWDCDTALMAGVIDGQTTDLMRAAYMEKQGVHLNYLTATDASWQLLTLRSARIKQLSQLDNKMIAMARYSATDFYADRLVDSAKLVSEKVFRIQVNDLGIRFSMLRSGIMDAMLLPEPQSTAARQLLSPVLFDSRRQAQRFGVLAFRKKLNATKSKALERLTAIYDKSVDTINAQGVRSFSQLIAQRCGVSLQVADSVPCDIRFHHAALPKESDMKTAKEWLQKRLKK